MKVECPKCGFFYNINEFKIPESGAFATCRKCNHRFVIKKQTINSIPEIKETEKTVSDSKTVQINPQKQASLENKPNNQKFDSMKTISPKPDNKSDKFINFYQILNVEPNASVEDIKIKIYHELRVWNNRTNLANFQRKQESENMVKLIEKAERILLNPENRKEYDTRLQTESPVERSLDKDDICYKEDELVNEGWRLLINGNIADAIYIATKATEKYPNNPETWALLAQAKFRWGEIEDAIYEYKRAIKLKPNESVLYFDLGAVYDSDERWDEAIKQYQKAAQISPSETTYRSAIGIVLVKIKKYKQSIDILEQCVKEDSDNETYKWFLALAYVESSYQNWFFVPEGYHVSSGYYATEKSHVKEAQQYIEKAESLDFSDESLIYRIKSMKNDITNMLERKFHGNWLVFIFAIVIGIGGAGEIFHARSVETFLINLGATVYFAGGAVFYFYACQTPKYILNRKLIAGMVSSDSVNLMEMFGEKGARIGELMGATMGGFGGYLFGSKAGGCLGAYIIIGFTTILIPFIAAWNYNNNFIKD